MKNRKKLRYLLVYLTDPKVTFLKKLLVFAPIVYLLHPMDVIPDFLLGPGQIDDILMMMLFLRKIQPDLERYIAKHSPSRGKTEKGPVIEKVE